MRFCLGRGEITLLNFGAAFVLAKTASLLSYLILINTPLDSNSRMFIVRVTELVCILTLLTANFLPHKFPLREILEIPSSQKVVPLGYQILLTISVAIVSRYVIELFLALPPAFGAEGINQVSEQLPSPVRLSGAAFSSLFMGKNVLAQITIVPFVEELIYRGVLLNLLLLRWNMTNSIVVSSVIFAIFHGNPLTAFLGGLLFAHIYVISRNLWLCILGHSCANVTVLFLNNYGDYIFPNSNSTAHVTGPNIWLCTVLAVAWLSALLIVTFRCRSVRLKSKFSDPSL